MMTLIGKGCNSADVGSFVYCTANCLSFHNWTKAESSSIRCSSFSLFGTQKLCLFSKVRHEVMHTHTTCLTVTRFRVGLFIIAGMQNEIGVAGVKRG